MLSQPGACRLSPPEQPRRSLEGPGTSAGPRCHYGMLARASWPCQWCGWHCRRDWCHFRSGCHSGDWQSGPPGPGRRLTPTPSRNLNSRQMPGYWVDSPNPGQIAAAGASQHLALSGRSVEVPVPLACCQLVWCQPAGRPRAGQACSAGGRGLLPDVWGASSPRPGCSKGLLKSSTRDH